MKVQFINHTGIAAQIVRAEDRCTSCYWDNANSPVCLQKKEGECKYWKPKKGGRK